MSGRDWADRLIARSVPDGPSGRAIAADLREELHRRIETHGRREAMRWYRRQALSIWFFSTRDRWTGSRWTSGRRIPVGANRAGSGSIRSDLADGLRVVRRAPGYAASVVLTLGIAMAATVSVFSVVRGVLLKDLPYPDADRLVRIDALRNGEPTAGGMDFPTFLDWREQLRTVSPLAAWQRSEGVFATDEVSEVWHGLATSTDFLEVVGVAPEVGEFPDDRNWQPGDQSLVLAYEVWERRFGADPAIIGRTIRFYEQSWTVVAVMPRGFRFFDEPADYWMPIRATQWIEGRGTGVFRVMGRLAGDASIQAARAELEGVQNGLRELYPGETRDVALRGVVEVERAPVRTMLWVFLGAVVFFLLVACANVAGLALARTEARRRELSVRMSLGAGRSRIARQLLAESVVLALLGGLVGLLGATVGLQGLLALAPADLPQRDSIAIDPVVVSAGLATALVAGILFGVVPGLRGASAIGPRPSATRTPSRGSRRAHRVLAGAQVAFAVVLLSGALLLIRSFSALNAVETGFTTPEQILVVEMGLGRAGYGEAERVLDFHDRLLQAVSALPGVEFAGVSTHPPFSAARLEASVVREDEIYRRGAVPLMGLETTNGDYRETLGLRLLAGRDPHVEPGDPDPPREVLVNEAGARLLWPQRSAIGERFSFDVDEGQPSDPDSYYTVVGVVPDVSDGGLDQDVRPRAYYSLPEFRQRYTFISGRFFYLVARTPGDPYALVDPIRAIAQDLDPNAPLRSVRSLEDAIRDTTLPARFRTVTLTVFAGLAVLVALLGVYGVMAFGVASAVRDIGVRMALGARASEVQRGVLRQAIGVAGAGVALGLLATAILARFIESMMFGVSTRDPVTIAGVVLLAGLGALSAAWLPARRASRIDPNRVLRQE